MTLELQTTPSETAEARTNLLRKCSRILLVTVVVSVGFFVYLAIFPTPQARALQRIRELGGNAGGSDDRSIDPFKLVGLSWPAFLPRLPMMKGDITGFAVEGKAVTDRDVEMFCAAFPLTTEAWLVSTPVSSEGLQPLATLPRLCRLRLYHTQADDRFLASLSSPDLQVLELVGAQITDEGVGRFVSSRSGISQLNLSSTVVTDQTCVELAKLKEIYLVDLTSTRVTATGVQLLQAAHPHCKIIWDGLLPVTNSE